MSKKVKVTLTLPEDVYAVGDKIADQEVTTISAWIVSKIRSDAHKKFGLDLDNPTPEDREKIVQWIEEQTRKKRRRSGVKGGGGTSPQ